MMHTGSFIGLMDTWFRILQELNTEEYTRILVSPHGGRVERIRELKHAGLVTSRLGMAGGHKLLIPFDEMPFSRLLALRDLPPCPTTNFLYLHADRTLSEIMSWKTKSRVGWAVSLGMLIAVLTELSHKVPVRYKDVRHEGISHGYILQILYRTSRLGITVPVGRSAAKAGIVLFKPFDRITIRDIAPMLSSRHMFYNTLIDNAGSVKLKTLLNEGGLI